MPVCVFLLRAVQRRCEIFAFSQSAPITPVPGDLSVYASDLRRWAPPTAALLGIWLTQIDH